MEKHLKNHQADESRLAEEKPFSCGELISEIYPLLTDYFECKQIAVKGGAIQMEFYNGQTFLIRAEEL